MRKSGLLLLFLFFTGSLFAQTSPLRQVTDNAFGPSEVLEFRVHYGFVDAGSARLEVRPEIKNINGHPCYQVVGTGRSAGAFDWFFKVRDRYESYIDTQAMVPWLFIRKIEEGGYKKNQRVQFDHFRNTATSEEKTIKTPTHIQDLVSAFYYARTIDFSQAKAGDRYQINTYLDDEVFPIAIEYLGKETVKTKAGVFRCIAFRPSLLEGRVFKDKEGMTLWVTDDLNRIPVRAEAEVLVGSIKMDLTSYAGLSNPVSLVK